MDNEAVPTLPDISKGASDAPSTNSGPDWDKVPFDIGCARCGHDLRGLQDPVCPACGLTFEWADALPVEELTCLHCGYHLYGLREPRCPECGERFAWEIVLDDYRRRRKPLFEYRWRKEPFRSLRASWWLAMRPWKLWRTVELHDPPSHIGLLVLLAITVIFFVISAPVIGYVGKTVIGLLQNLAAPPGARMPLWIALGHGYDSYLFRSYGYLNAWSRGAPGYPELLLGVALWWMTGLVALMILRQSMRRCKVRTAQFWRLYVYAMIPVAAGHPTFWVILALLDGCEALLPSCPEYIQVIGQLVGASFLFVVWFWVPMSLALGYRLYIKMKYAWAVSFATQGVALLAAWSLMLARVWW